MVAASFTYIASSSGCAITYRMFFLTMSICVVYTIVILWKIIHNREIGEQARKISRDTTKGLPVIKYLYRPLV